MNRVLYVVPLALLFAACDPTTAPETPAHVPDPALLSITSVQGFDPNGPHPSIPDVDIAGPQLVSEIGNPVPDSVIVVHNGLEWVWASPCAQGAEWCGPTNTVGHDGFNFATLEQWAERPPVTAFGTGQHDMKCAAPWFDVAYDNCNWSDAQPALDDAFHDCCNLSTYGSAPAGVGGAAGGYGDPMHPVADTWLVRVADPQTRDDCKDGGWEQYGFKNQGQCVRFVETGKDSR